ncbi:MAG: extracellular solute-binding protein [Infirmifilum sp.]
MVTRRQFIYLIGGAAAVAALGGGLYFLTQRQAPSTPPKKIGGKVTILGRSGYHEAINRNLISTFNKKYPDVTFDYVPKGYDDEYQTIILSMQNKSPDYDVIYIDEPWIHMMIDKGWLLPIDNADISDYPDLLKTWPSKGGKIYALGITGNVNFFWYRKDILNSLGEQPPQTWDDVLRIAKKVKAKYTDQGQKVYGFGAYAVKGTSVAQDTFPAFLYPFGGSYFAADGVTPALNSPEAVNALSFFKELLQYSHPRTTQFQSLDEYSQAILNGEIAMGVAWNAWIANVDDPQKSKVVGQIEVMPYPKQKVFFGVQSGVWYYGVSAFSTNPDTAMEYTRVATSFDAQKRAALEAGLPPTRLSVFNDPDYRSKFRLADSWRKLLEVVKPVRTNPLWGSMSVNVGNYLYMGLIGQLSVEEAIQKAYQEMVRVTSGTS